MFSSNINSLEQVNILSSSHEISHKNVLFSPFIWKVYILFNMTGQMLRRSQKERESISLCSTDNMVLFKGEEWVFRGGLSLH